MAVNPRLTPVLDFVTARTGLVFDEHRIAMAEARISEAMGRTGINDSAGFIERLRTNAEIEDALIADLTIGETYFYRDPDLFEYLRSAVLPRMGQRRSDDGVVRVWSAGCSSGEEAYTLAMLLEEEGLGRCSSVLGTDVRRDSLARARRGTYGSWSFRGTDEAMLVRYFTRAQGTYTLSQALRDRVRFDQHNLVADVYPVAADGPGGFDLIVCRNVLMYFDPRIVERVARALHASLREAGLLVISASDPALDRMAPFCQVASDAAVIYERAGNVPVRPADAGPSGRRTSPVPPPGGRRAPAAERLPPPAAVVAVSAAAEVESAFVARVHERARQAGTSAAVAQAREGMIRYPLSAEMPFLQAVVLAGAGRHAEAVAAARNALYLDRFSPAIHFVLGASLWNLGDLAGARRGFRNARELAAALPADDVVPYTEGETAGRVARGAAAQLAMLPPSSGVTA